MSILDDAEAYPALDPTGLADRLHSFPDLCSRAWTLASDLPLPAHYRNARRIIIAGMGGSSIGGDLLADLASLETAPPIHIHRDYDLPSHADESTLVIASSYSGNTAETLSGFRRALGKRAMLVAVTSGGILAQEATDAGVPVLPIDFEGEPRCALSYSFLGPLGILVRLGFLSDKQPDLEDALEALTAQIEQSLGRNVPLASNPAKVLATALDGRLPVIYGGGYFQAVARRWKTQLNENAKVWAQWEVLPEAHHNAVSGLKLPAAMRDLAAVVLLRPEPLHPSVAWRFKVTEELLEYAGISYPAVEGQGDSPLSQLLSTVLLGDFVSYYLALLQGVDPSPVPDIDSIKQRLST